MSVVETDHELIVLPSVLYLPRSGRMNVARAFSEAVSKFDLMPVRGSRNLTVRKVDPVPAST
jgi:hypothetical protein